MSIMLFERIYERIIRRLVSEGVKDPPDTTGLACAFQTTSKQSWGFVYDVEKMTTYMTDSDFPKVEEASEIAGKAFIQIMKPQQPSWEAWEVKASAGDGKLAYAVGFALSPSLLLIPDRMSVSPEARGGWRKQATGGRRMKKLDNAKYPKTPALHDDSYVYGPSDEDSDVLDYAFDAVGWERKAFRDMVSRWDQRILPAAFAMRCGLNLFNRLFEP